MFSATFRVKSRKFDDFSDSVLVVCTENFRIKTPHWGAQKKRKSKYIWCFMLGGGGGGLTGNRPPQQSTTNNNSETKNGCIENRPLLQQQPTVLLTENKSQQQHKMKLSKL